MDVDAAILYACQVLETRGNPIDRQHIAELLDRLKAGNCNLGQELTRLENTGHLTCSDTATFALTEKGRALASAFHSDYQRAQYNRFMLTLWHSQAYLDFCSNLYGYRWCLLNSLFKEQYRYLFDELKISPGDTILDIGCGSGAILHRLATRYRCRGIGVDLATDLISIIRNRYSSESFYEVDIEDLPALGIDADIVVSTDSLYTCRDLTAAIGGLKTVCRKRLYAFYSQTVDNENGDRSTLHPDNTDLARALTSNNLSYVAVDFSADEWNLWRREKEILPDHRAAFEIEGNLGIWEGRVADTESMLRLFEDTRAARFLYRVELTPDE